MKSISNLGDRYNKFLSRISFKNFQNFFFSIQQEFIQSPFFSSAQEIKHTTLSK